MSENFVLFYRKSITLLNLNTYLVCLLQERINFALDHLRGFPSIVENNSQIGKLKAVPNTLKVDGIEGIGLCPLSRNEYGWQQKYE